MRDAEAMQDGPNTHFFRTYSACAYHIVETKDVDGVTHRFHVPLEVVAAITSPLNQKDIERGVESLRLKRRVEELEAALTEACTCMEGLADQQAMDDDWYVEPLARCRKLLSPQEKP